MVVILIGPMKVGKSTVARLLAERLGLERNGLDKRRWAYFAEIGYDESYAHRLAQDEGMQALLRYWKRFEVHAVERHLANADDCVIDFGAGYSVQEEPAFRERIRRALEPYKNVVLLQPSPDPMESAAYLGDRISSELQAANRRYLMDSANRELARIVIYTMNKSPQETCDELVERLELQQG
jgi:shikimate kinase